MMSRQKHPTVSPTNNQTTHEPLWPSTTTSQVRTDSLCLYPSKECRNPRSRKRFGGLHRFCEFHRERANINQRRVDQRKRLRERAAVQKTMDRPHSNIIPTTTSSLPVVSDNMLFDMSLDDLFLELDGLVEYQPLEVSLSTEDLAILHEILNNDLPAVVEESIV